MDERCTCNRELLNLAFKQSDTYEYTDLLYCSHCEKAFTKKLIEVKF